MLGRHKRPLAAWQLGESVGVARRAPGRDKEVLFRASCAPPCAVLEYSDHYLELGKELRAFTAGVRHTHNPPATVSADLTAHL